MKEYQMSGKSVKTIGVKAVFFTTDKISENEVYKIVKEIVESIDELKKASPALQNLKVTDMMQDSPIPFHKGAVKFFKEYKANKVVK